MSRAADGGTEDHLQWFKMWNWSGTGTPDWSKLLIACLMPRGVMSRVGSLSRRTIKMPNEQRIDRVVIEVQVHEPAE